jgi:hypothetical protein
MKLHIVQSSTASRHMLPNFLLSSLISNPLNLCFSFSVRDQDTNPETTGNITVLYILIFKFFERRRQDRRLSWMVVRIPEKVLTSL